MRLARASAMLLPVVQAEWEKATNLTKHIFLKASVDFQKCCVSVIPGISAFEWHTLLVRTIPTPSNEPWRKRDDIPSEKYFPRLVSSFP